MLDVTAPGSGDVGGAFVDYAAHADTISACAGEAQ